MVAATGFKKAGITSSAPTSAFGRVIAEPEPVDSTNAFLLKISVRGVIVIVKKSR